MYSFQGDIPRECIVRYWAFLSAPLFLEKDRFQERHSRLAGRFDRASFLNADVIARGRRKKRATAVEPFPS